ncbi:MAG: hypothetical protein EP339_06705 [Gammaproteobacteria bacterium]|uniref:Lipoprotein n=1 Tax=Marinobacter nitratireducens TaxID=1137280 RepID=A0A072N761_9GAMM|nr:YcfL family protein [Marinobacter nitratireducens]KEF33077.1 hypothetical protein D777_00085 [Marinobacter nitratireducens]TNE77072.1 MAG: hypothetical protein EP339_06705 [Gammaproteobacteria bacterium]
MSKSLKTLMAAALGVSLLSGCAYKSSSSTELTERTAPITMNSVVFSDYKLSRSWTEGIFGADKRYVMSVVKHGQRQSPTGTSEVYAVLRNHTDYDYRIEARTQFFDQDGVPTDVKPTWQRMTVPANGLSTYRELSTTTQPLQYRVEVRELN